jgi:sugar lactone lactonase YvrE
MQLIVAERTNGRGRGAVRAAIVIRALVGAVLLYVAFSPAATQNASAETYAQAVEGTAGVSHFWPMGESSGSSFADTVGGANAEVSGGVTLGQPGGLIEDPATSAAFDGSSGAAQAPVDLSGTSKLTIEFWMKWTAFAGDDRLALEFTPNFNEHPGGFLVDPDATPGSEFAVTVGNGSHYNNVLFTRPSAEQWHYYAFVIDTGASGEEEITPYVDGHAVSYTKLISDTGAGNFANSTLFWMSRDASSLFGAGSMQDLALYDGTLGPETILEHYDLGEHGPKAAFASLPVVATAGVPVRFDASGSASPGGELSDYAWDFDGSEAYGSDEGGSATISHTFSTPGTYTVDLRVRDGFGETGTVSHTITVNAALGPYEQAVEDTAGVAHFWPMGETSGSAFADVVGGADAATSGGVTLGEPGGLVEDPSTAALFDGSSGAAQASVDLSSTHKLTVEFWMKWSSFADDDALALEFTPNFNVNLGGFLIDPNSSSDSDFSVAVGQAGAGHGNNVLFARPSAGQWHYYAFVIDTGASGEEEITPYVDGHAVSYTKLVSDTGAGNFADSTLYWMSRDASSLFGAGSMQDLALYDSTLGPEAILEHYELGDGGPKASFVTSPVDATAGVPVNLDASASSSPSGVSDYAWDFDGSESYASDEGSSATISHTFSTPGTYTVDLRVRDGLGKTASVSRTITVGEALSPYEQAVEDTAGVSHFWPMSETLGSSFADVVGGADATTSGGVTLGEPGGLVDDASSSALFDGLSGAAQTPVDLSGTSKLTIEFWMKWASFADDDRLALELTPNFNEHPGGFLVDPDSSAESDFAVALGQTSTGHNNNDLFARPSAEQWHYYAFVLDTSASGATEITPYIDGHAVSYTKLREDTGAGSFADSTLYWMSRDASSLFGAGSMQDLALYNTTLSSGTILEHYDRGENTYRVVNTTAPSIEGTARDGQTLTANLGSWTGFEPISYEYQWEKCNSSGESCSDISGATGSTYILGHSDVGSTLRVVVTASNAGSSASSTSEASEVIVALAPSDTAAPTISGTAEEGQTLTASKGEWEGTPPIAYAYQWQSCNSVGASCLNIAGASGASYKPRASDVGGTVRVLVYAENSAGFVTATSLPSAVVVANAPVSVEAPKITGTAKDGQLLTVGDGTWEGAPPLSYTYQWELCNSSGGSCEALAGASESNYRVLSSQTGDTLRAVVSATNAVGSTEATSGASATITTDPPVNVELPAISGTVQDGETLSVSTGTWAGSEPIAYSYQWQRCYGSETECTNIKGATAATYVLGHEDVGTTPQVVVTAKNSVGSTSVPSEVGPVTEAVAPSNIWPPEVEGLAQEGTRLRVKSPGEWSGSPQVTFSYQWQDCDGFGAECVPIAGATGTSYVLGPKDVGEAIRVEVTANAVDRVSASSVSEATVPVASGPYYVGQFTGTGADQLSAPSDVAVGTGGDLWVVDWAKDRVEEFNEAGEYLAQFGSAGSGPGKLSAPAAIAVSGGKVWVADSGNDRVEGFSEAGEYLASLTGTPAGSFRGPEGVAVDSAGNVWVSDKGRHRIDEFRANGEYVKAIGESTLIEQEGIAIDAKGDIWVGDSYRDKVYEFSESGELLREIGEFGSGDGEFKNPDGIGVNAEGDVWVADVGNDRVEEFSENGEYLTQFGGEGSGEGEFQMSPGPAGLAISSAGDVWVTDLENGRVQQWTNPSAGPVDSLAPSIVGEAAEGATLSATDGAWSGSPVRYTYEWQLCNAAGEECEEIEGAHAQTYALESSDVGDSVRVLVSADNAGGSATVASTATSTIVSATALSNTALPTISGTARDGSTLSVSTGTWSGTPARSYEYQWESCDSSGEACAPIEGAEKAEYALGDGDIGTTLRVVVTAANAAGSAHATSAVSAKVLAEAPSEIEAPSVSGTPDEHQVLYADHGAWAGTERQFSYQWESCDSSGSECAPITGATEPEYDLGEGDVSTTVRVRVGMSSTAGSLTDVSPVTPVIGSAGALASTGPPSVVGTSEVGKTLTATHGSWSDTGTLSYAYQWQSCDRFGRGCANIEGATSASYVLTTGDAGHALRVQVTASAEEHSISRYASVTQPIAAAGAPAVERSPLVEGTTLEGSTLTTTTGWWSGEEPIGYAYQWERCKEDGECAPIEGATTSSYTLSASDTGYELRVLVTATDGHGSTEALSSATVVIDPEALERFSTPSIAGAVVIDGELEPDPGIWSGTGQISYAYQWESCNSSGSECASIEGATEAGYELVEGDHGHTLRVKVTATGPFGSESAHSATTVATPGGEVTVEQAEEAAQTADPAILAPSTTIIREEQLVAPALTDEEQLTAKQSLTSSSISKENPGEFAVNTPDGELSVKPQESSSKASTLPTLVNGTVALFANTSPATDTIIRPDALGATTVLNLRSAEAPKSFSWEVGLGAGEQLSQLANGSVAVVSVPEESTGEPETKPSKEPESNETGEEAPESSSEKEEKEKEEAESETEVPEETLPSAPTSSTTPAETPAGELEPQKTREQYETATSAMATAEAQFGTAALMTIEQPQVIDADGHTVPASLSVNEDTITLTIKPTETTTYPLLVDISVAAPSDTVSGERDPFEYGLSEEKEPEPGEASDFESEKFKNLLSTTSSLHAQTTRETIPWDILRPFEASKLKAFEQWLKTAETDHLTPYVTLKSDGINGPPAVPAYRAAIRRIIKRFGRKIKRWGAWNEPEQGKNTVPAARGADYWQAAESVAVELHCGCTIVAGEFAQYETDSENTNKEENRVYVGKYRKGIREYYPQAWEYNHDHKPKHKAWEKNRVPHTWGLHDYSDVVNLRHTNLAEFEQFAKTKLENPRIWISEVGVELHDGVKEGGPTRLVKKSDELYEYEQQSKAAETILGFRHTTAPHEKVSPIERVYYFGYEAPSEEKVEKNGNEFDTGLVEVKPENKGKSLGEERPAYCVLAYASHDCPPTIAGTFYEKEDVRALVNPHGLATTVEFPVEEFSESLLETISKPKIASGVIHPQLVSGGRFYSCSGHFKFHAVATSSGGSTKGPTVEAKNPTCGG